MWQYASLDITFINDPPELLAKQIPLFVKWLLEEILWASENYRVKKGGVLLISNFRLISDWPD